MVQRAAAAALRVLVPHGISPRGPALGGRVHGLEGRTMGTSWSVRLVGPKTFTPEPVAQAVQRELDAVVAQMSPWDAGSDVSRFNAAPIGHWQALPPAFCEVLAYALQVARESGGAYDPTAGALVDAWGFGPRGGHDVPGFLPPREHEIAAARAASGWQRLAFDPDTRRARQPGGLALDFSSIAKGYAVDRVSALLAERFGFDDTLVEVGGELRGRGVKPDGQPWWVALERVPLWRDGAWNADVENDQGHAPAGLPTTRVALHGLSIATSGDYRRFFAHGGERRPHTIDPRTGRPIANGVALVTVLHERCMAADALSTALNVLGPEAGLAFADARGLAALFVVRERDGRLGERMSQALAAMAS